MSFQENFIEELHFLKPQWSLISMKTMNTHRRASALWSVTTHATNSLPSAIGPPPLQSFSPVINVSCIPHRVTCNLGPHVWNQVCIFVLPFRTRGIATNVSSRKEAVHAEGPWLDPRHLQLLRRQYRPTWPVFWVHIRQLHLFIKVQKIRSCFCSHVTSVQHVGHCLGKPHAHKQLLPHVFNICGLTALPSGNCTLFCSQRIPLRWLIGLFWLQHWLGNALRPRGIRTSPLLYSCFFFSCFQLNRWGLTVHILTAVFCFVFAVLSAT